MPITSSHPSGKASENESSGLPGDAAPGAAVGPGRFITPTTSRGHFSVPGSTASLPCAVNATKGSSSMENGKPGWERRIRGLGTEQRVDAASTGFLPHSNDYCQTVIGQLGRGFRSATAPGTAVGGRLSAGAAPGMSAGGRSTGTVQGWDAQPRPELGSACVWRCRRVFFEEKRGWYTLNLWHPPKGWRRVYVGQWSRCNGRRTLRVLLCAVRSEPPTMSGGAWA